MADDRRREDTTVQGAEPAAEPLPYAEVTDAGYAARVAETFTVRQFGPAVLLDGDCPRCQHPITCPIVGEVYRREEEAPTTADSGYRTVLCGCAADHPARPDGLTGCGAYWTLLLEVEA
ncbi:hypothetical protein KIF24_00165 [Micromonospora sp. Llam7]|uniref:hypothetical protein n=1 Tax=Micromonospora tarapacensis TaxID=2835305 RepID=UPI001C83ACAA|nr:hypothetical protein [Micromonospora tarapacensis]MBX7264627.1 hypothetical protein [Micromonospora tarapacensis]